MTKAAAPAEVSEQAVVAYLRAHPDLLSRHPELLAVLTPPSRGLGAGVVDFQQFQLKNLQSSSRELNERYQTLVNFCRDNFSVQTQVHDAVLRLIAARSLGALLEVMTLDLVSLFNVDVVRLAVESGAQAYAPPPAQDEDGVHSGIVLVSPGSVQAALAGRKALLIEDCEVATAPGVAEIFADCESLARSCALLSLDIAQANYGGRQRGALLAFGVRYPGRFQAGQGVELLSFLARIVAHQLETHLADLDV